MSLYKDASLVMIPTAYKDGKLYSIRPIPEYGSEEITNGDFATDSDWIKSTGWTITGGQLVGTNTSVYAKQNSVVTNGKEYRVEIDVASVTAGKFRMVTTADASTYTKYITAAGTYVFDMKPVSSVAGGIEFVGTSFTGAINSISVKEITNSGDFTFSRGSNLAATRVASSGYIEKGRENLLLQSNQFDTTWQLTNAPTLTSGQSGYDGTNNAWKLEASTTGSSRSIHQVVSTSGVQVFSVYVKAGTTSWIRLNLSGIGNRYFDIGNGIVGGSGSMDGFITDVGGGWYRCSVLGNGSSTAPYIFLASDNGNLAVNAGDNIYIQDAQLESSLVATSVISTGASTAQAGILEDMPRLDYSGGASCPALLLEPQRTNLWNHSEYISGNPLVSSPIITENYAVSPEGLSNAFRIQDTTSGSFKRISISSSGLSVSPNSTYTQSFFVKKATSQITNYGGMGFDYTGGTTRKIAYVVFDEYNGTLAELTSSFPLNTTLHPVEDYGDYWRFSVSTTDNGNNTNLSVNIYACLSTNGTSAGTGTKDWTGYGIQLESGSYPTSYIPTYGSSVTRSGDGAEVTSASSIIGQTQGVMFFEFIYKPFAEDMRMGISDGTSANYNNIRITSGGTLYVLGSASSVLQYEINAGSLTSGQTYKVALKYNTNDIEVFVNGVSKGTDTSASPAACNRLGFDNRAIGQNPVFSDFKQAVLFPTALTDSECIALTTL